MALASVILEKASVTLKDPEFVRWTKPELLDWLSEAQVAIARVPGSYSITSVFALVEGTRQTLPEDAWQLVTVTRNCEEDGYPLTPVRLVTRELLDASMPWWHTEAGKPLVENYVYDERDPHHFYVYPPNDGSGHCELTYMGIPAAITDEKQELVLDDSYLPALLSYVLFRAISKDADYAAGAQAAAAYFQAYNTELTATVQARGLATPNASLNSDPVNASGGTE